MHNSREIAWRLWVNVLFQAAVPTDIEKTASALLFCQWVIAWSPAWPSWMGSNTVPYIQSELASVGKWIMGLIYTCCNRSTADHRRPIISDRCSAGSLKKRRSVGPIRRHQALGRYCLYHMFCYIFSLCVWGFVVHCSRDRVDCWKTGLEAAVWCSNQRAG